MEHAVSTVLVVWGVVIAFTVWIAANALADLGARRIRHWLHSSRRPRV
jgi:hypothetical protein